LARGFGTCWDHFAVIFKFPGDRIVTFNSKQVGHGYDDILCRMYGTDGTVDTHYFGKVTLSAKEDGFQGGTPNLYQAGAVANIAAFHEAIRKGDYTNATVPESVRSNLTTILGRTAAYGHREVTWREMMSDAEEWEFDLSGLKG
jgi:predicted dehydrogenase